MNIKPTAWMKELPTGEGVERAVRTTTVKEVADDWEQAIPLYTADDLRAAVLAEREACAKICDDISWSNEGKWFAVDSGKLMKYVKEEQKPVRILELKIDSDCMDEIVKADLAGVRDSLRLDLERRKQGKYSNGIFHHDKKKDIAEVRKHINAFNLILKYYNVPE
jgi:hypothetical protein